MSKKKEGQIRECLKCGEPFLSEGNWNRLCNKCRKENDLIWGDMCDERALSKTLPRVLSRLGR